jgi:hypothetical protein
LAIEKSNHWRRMLLRARNERPRDRRAAESGNEFPPCDVDRHFTRPYRHHGRRNLGTVSRPNRQVCDALHDSPTAKRARRFSVMQNVAHGPSRRSAVLQNFVAIGALQT